MNATTSDGVRIDYADLGQGEPALVLMTAWCMSRNGFADLSDKLAANHRVLALDWRGHGASEKPAQDFGAAQLVEDVLAVVEASGVDTFIPVTMSHSGWVGIELRERLGAARVPKIVHLDWVVLPPPPMYMDLVHGLADPNGWQQARDVLFNIWLEGVDNQDVISFVRDEMGSYDADTWMRSGREIGGCYQRGGYPLKALSELDPPAPTLHIYSQPPDEGYYQAQVDFAGANPWYHVHRLAAHSHFPTFELSDEIASTIEDFVGKNEGWPSA
jgi:pimeloyl-ACP methyl ester carboxylesterase